MTINRTKSSIFGGLVAVTALVFPWSAFGQASFEAQIRGSVHDSSGSLIAGAKLTVTDVSTGISNTATTDARGSYILNGLRPATYTIKVDMTGFRSEAAKD